MLIHECRYSVAAIHKFQIILALRIFDTGRLMRLEAKPLCDTGLEGYL
jgi:hypothetical protein